jgi:hypothetical protein
MQTGAAVVLHSEAHAALLAQQVTSNSRLLYCSSRRRSILCLSLPLLPALLAQQY